ncbi:hypothetical protein F2Q69_00020722 [Brassica cretica]|uniref:Uncharacterized protein n=1 Tax=Brassica cretica TaxID=69181 RepID=A0A8S9PZ92_BRACR|nr:hypothetical protein F2Q69_00020722 [Brassica cretica]
MFLGIYRGTPFLGIFRGTPFLGIFRGTRSSEFSDENSEEHFIGTSEDWTIGKSIEISRGCSPSVYSEELSDEQVVLRISSEICLLGIPSENSEGFPRKNEFPRSYFRGLVSSVYFMIHGFTPVGRANHYMPSLKACTIVKVDGFEVARCSSMYKITDHLFLIRFISLSIIDEVITCAPEINLQSRLDCSTISK